MNSVVEFAYWKIKNWGCPQLEFSGHINLRNSCSSDLWILDDKSRLHMLCSVKSKKIN